MTSADRRLERVRLLLLGAALLTALFWGESVAIAATMLGLGYPVSFTLGLVVAIVVLHRLRHRASRSRVALWVEEQVPSLRFALVTAVDRPEVDEALHAQVAATDFEPVARRAILRSLALPAVALVTATTLLVTVGSPSASRGADESTGSRSDGISSSRSSVDRITVTVTPPRYTGLAKATLDDPVRIAAVAGSAITVGAPLRASVAGTSDSVALTIAADSGRWSAAFAMPTTPTMLRFSSAGATRLMLLEPRLDSIPTVVLDTPARDTVLRAATGSVSLAAHLRDDFGLSEGRWEVVISHGEGERFEFRTLTLGRSRLGAVREVARVFRLPLDSLGLTPGDILHLRAVGRDANDVTGPGIGSSDTRTIRIAREGEYDSLAVEGIPPPDPLKGLLSQRMLIMLTEALERKRPRLGRPALLAEAGPIARDQNALRRQVGDVIFSRLEDGGSGEHSHDDGHDHGALTPEALLEEAEAATDKATGERLDFAAGESPVVAINRPLLEAYNAMWDAGRELGIGDTRKALPHMYVALAAIQRARQAERVYLRGATKPIVVDLAKVRLVGKTDGIAPGARAPRTAADPASAARARRLEAAIDRLPKEPAAAIDSLLLLRAELLGTPGAEPLGAAIDALRAGRDATAELIRTRRAFLGPIRSARGLSRWTGFP